MSYFFDGGDTFVCANTTNGFRSLMPRLFRPDTVHRIYLLQGTPGGGKSTFLKQCRRALQGEGIACEAIHCSSDPRSLDGVYAKSVSLVLLDATSPHALLPALPGCCEIPLVLSEFLDTEKIERHRGALQDLARRKKRAWENAYSLLGAADTLGRIPDDALPPLSAEEQERLLSLLPPPRGEDAREQEECRFLSAFCADGEVSYPYHRQTEQTLLLVGSRVEEATASLSFLLSACRRRGIGHAVFLSALHPDLPEGFVTADGRLQVRFHRAGLPVPDNAVVRQVAREGYEEENRLFRRGLTLACRQLKIGRDCHMRAEAIYTSCTDFAALEEYRTRFLNSRLLPEVRRMSGGQ